MAGPGKNKTWFVKFPKKQSKIAGLIFEVIDSLKSAVIVVFLIFLLAVRVVGVSGDSMNPTLKDGNWLGISSITLNIKNGDIVVVVQPWERNIPIVKRVIAMPGDTLDIDFENGIVYLNGQKLDEPYIAEPTHLEYNANLPLTVPEGYLFVMGDNRNDSLDSRSGKIGLIRDDYVLGKALFRFYPDPVSLFRFYPDPVRLTNQEK
ncbi:MAG: signal peptidase I [Clostridia bacterium]|nr:signal peptidase I [Clostridia bacterium]